MKREEVSGVCRLSEGTVKGERREREGVEEGERRERDGVEWGGRPPLAMHTPLGGQNIATSHVVLRPMTQETTGLLYHIIACSNHGNAPRPCFWVGAHTR